MSWDKIFKSQKKQASASQNTSRPNKKGSGFQFITPHSSSNKTKKLMFSAAALFLGAALIITLMSKNSTPEFLILTLVLGSLCTLIGLDIISRRRWEKSLGDRVNKLTLNHDRLVQQVAHNRNDTAAIKAGLADTAAAIEKQGRQMTPTRTAEARLIETMAEKLGMLGDKPRGKTGTQFDKNILELEMTPPPRKPLPRSKNDMELNPDYTKYSDTVISELLEYALRNDQIDLFMQPIVRLPQRKAGMYELYARIRAGSGVYIPATRYMKLARTNGVMPSIDNLLLLQSLKNLRESHSLQTTVPSVMNISAHTLRDSNFMGDLVTFLAKHRAMAKYLIFEISQADLVSLNQKIIPILTGLSRLGCRFSMDNVRNKQLDISWLKSHHIRFVKLDASWLIRESTSRPGYSRVLRMKKSFDAAGIDLIIERIEREDHLRELLDFNIDFGQGVLFGKPDLMGAYRQKRKEAAA